MYLIRIPAWPTSLVGATIGLVGDPEELAIPLVSLSKRRFDSLWETNIGYARHFERIPGPSAFEIQTHEKLPVLPGMLCLKISISPNAVMTFDYRIPLRICAMQLAAKPPDLCNH